MHVTGAHVFVDLLSQRVTEIWPQAEDDLSLVPDEVDSDSNPDTLTAFFRDPIIQGIMERISHHLTAVADSLLKVQFNFLLAFRDSVLQRSGLTPDQQANLRCLPGQDASLFGEYAPQFVAHRAEANRDAAAYAVGAPRPPRQFGPRGNFKRPASRPPFRAPPPKRRPSATVTSESSQSAPAFGSSAPPRHFPSARPKSNFRPGTRPPRRK